MSQVFRSVRAAAVISPKKLGELFNIGSGVSAQFTRMLEGELSYRGAVGSAYRENGVFATVKLRF